MVWLKQGIQKYIDQLEKWADATGNEFTRSIYHHHIGDLQTAIQRIELYEHGMPDSLPTDKDLEKEADLRYPDTNQELDTWSSSDIVKLERNAFIQGRQVTMSRVKVLEAENERLKEELHGKDIMIQVANEEFKKLGH